jgi:glycerophosphoryl diester phosphodiesterase
MKGIVPRQIADGPKAIVVHGGSAPQRYRDVLQALDSALTLGTDALELDVRRTADDTLVVHHDAEIGEARLADLSFAAASRLARANGYELPRFEAVIARLHGRVWLDVELKEPGYESRVLAALFAAGYSDQTVAITSFEQPALDAVHAARPSLPTGLLVYDCTWEAAVALFRRSGATFLGPEHVILDDAALTHAASAGILLLPWTVNDRAGMKGLLAARAVVGLITDQPAVAISAQAEQLRRPTPDL